MSEKDTSAKETKVTSGSPSVEAGRCIVTFSTKGGVGKTTIATNLAVALTHGIRKPVCLVDLDVGGTGDLAKMLGLNPEHTVVELAGRLKREPVLKELPLENLAVAHASGVHVVQCLANPRHGHLLDAHLLEVLFKTLKARYSYVVVDSGKGLTDALVSAFDAANLILLVATPDIISLYQTKGAMSIIESLLFPAAMVKGVLNRARSRGGVGLADARMAMPCEVVGEIPSDGAAVGNAANQGSPVVTLYSFSKIAEAFRRLANELIDQPDNFLPQIDVPRCRQQADGAASRSGFATGSARLFVSPEELAVQEQGEDEITKLKRRVHGKLVSEFDLKQTDIGGMGQEAHLEQLRERCRRVVANLLSRELGGVLSSHELRNRLVKEILDEALGLGPLEEYLEDAAITDILVNTKDQIYVERHGKLELTTKRFTSDEQLRAVIERIVAPLGRRIDEANPMVDARLPDGSRVNAVIPPLAVKGPTLSIRKFSRIHLTQDNLIEYGSVNRPMMEFVQACVRARKNIMISGGTGSGKTTMLNVISGFIPDDERILTLEDAAELRLSQAHWVSLEARPANVEGTGHIAIRDLFRNALRMRPDRIIIGECRGSETLDMLQAMNTGHDGSITTIHANSPKDVVSRLDSMVLMSDIELPVRAIREMVASALHVVIHTARLSDGSRKILSITELVELTEHMDIVFRDLFVFQQTGLDPDGTVLGDYQATGHLPTFFEELKVKGLALEESVFQASEARVG